MLNFSRWGFSLTAALVALTACGPNTPTTPAATVLQINGTRVLSATSLQFGVTALDGSQVVSTGQISSPQVTFSTAGVSGTVSVCGQITAQNVVTAAVTLDATGSMSTTDPAKNRNTAAKSFVDRMTGDSQAAILSFDASTTPSTGMLASRLRQSMTSDKALLKTAIDAATYANGSTNFYDAVIDAVTVAKAAGRTNPIVLALTDGEDNSSDKTADEAIAFAKSNGVPVYAVGLDATNSINFTEMERIASQTGGLFRSNISSVDLNDYFSKLYNAFTAQGCVQLNLAAAPASGSTVAGTLSMDVTNTGKATARLSVPFTYTAR